MTFRDPVGCTLVETMPVKHFLPRKLIDMSVGNADVVTARDNTANKSAYSVTKQ